MNLHQLYIFTRIIIINAFSIDSYAKHNFPYSFYIFFKELNNIYDITILIRPRYHHHSIAIIDHTNIARYIFHEVMLVIQV